MKRTKWQRITALFMALFMGLSMISWTPVSVSAAGEKKNVTLVAFPRDGDSHYDDDWGRDDLHYKNGWFHTAVKKVTLHIMDDDSSQIAYCIEPGTPLQDGYPMTGRDEAFFDDYPAEYNDILTPDDIKVFLGRILQYGYTGNVSIGWKSQNPDDAAKLSEAIATQLLIWEVIVGERDGDFGHVEPVGYDAILDSVREGHPLRSQILQAYRRIETAVQNHGKVPSFCERSTGKAKTVELSYSSGKYTAALTDTNGVLDAYTFSAGAGITLAKSGNTLTVTANTAPKEPVMITASKTNGMRKGLIVWTDGLIRPGERAQDLISFAEEVSDPVSGFVYVTASLGGMKIVKTSEDGKVDGIQFRITGNGIDKTVTTASGGQIQIDNLSPGVYTVTELPDEKYEPQESRQVTVVSGQTATVTFNNKLKRGDLTVTKTAEDGLEQGMKFHLYGTSLSGLAVDEYAVVGSDGKAYFRDVLVGTGYTLEEVDTPDRYVVPDDQTADIEWKKVTTKDFDNKLKRGDLTVTKVAEDGLDEGIRFHLYGTSDSGIAVDEYAVTDSSGKAYFKDILIGTGYTLEEVDTPDRYVIPDDQTADIEWNKVTDKDFDNKLKRGDLVVTKTAEDGLDEGIRFHLYGISLSGIAVDEYAVTDSSGKAYFKDILIGTGYTLEEVDTPDRYVIPDDQTADIEWNKVTDKDFDNKLKRGDLVVTKTAEDGLTEGMRFRLHGTSYSGLPVDETRSVGADGKAYFNDILIGTGYVLEEVGTPNRYVVPDNQTTVIEWEKVTNRDFHNILKKWNVTVTKRDSETDTPQGDASLAGAVYGIYQGGELIDRYTTDADGKFTTKYYLCGDNWTLREITPSEGYLIDPTEYHIGAESKNFTVEYNATPAIGSPEDVIKGKIAIIKHTDDGSTQIETPEVGAAFEVFLKSAGSYAVAKETERDRLVCDENGFAETKELPYGVYTVHQVSGWDGRELLPDFDVYIAKDGQTYRYLINNSNFESYIKIVKTDAETGEIVPYAGAGFQIYDPDGNLVSMSYTYPQFTTIDTFYTGAEGYLLTPEKLPYGNGYSIVEVQAPYGYVLNSDPVYFDITADSATLENAVTVVMVNRPNAPQKGKITVTKTGEVFASVSESGDVCQPVYEVKGLPGAVYEVTAVEDIYTPDGTLRYVKGTVVDTVTTGEDGTATSKALYLGKYEIREVTAPYGMVLNGEIHTVELTYARQEIKITETATEFYNERQKVEVDLNKVMEKDDRFGIGENGEILSVQFGLFAAEDIVAADGSAIPKDGLIETVTCDENGHAVFATDLPAGAKLYVKEIATDSHYILSDTQYPVVFEYAGQDTAIVHITVGDEPLVNELIYGSVKGHKTDRETGENIAGAVFGLFAYDATEYTEDNAILTAVTGENGVFTFENLPYGSYVIVELSPAEGYLPNKETHHVHVTTDGEVIEISVVNDKIPELETTAESDGEKLIHPDEQIVIDDEVAYKHLIPGKEYTVKGVLMDKATGEAFLVDGKQVDGKQVVAETTFIPTEPSGTVTVTFTFEGKGITQNTELVVFESLYKDGMELAVHADIEDEGQTVTVLVPEIGTQASSDGEKVRHPDEKIVIEDTVSYENLIPGKEYTLKGVLMDKVAGEPFLVDGQTVTSEVAFTPTEPSGMVNVTFVFDGSGITQNTDLVVFESLYKDGIELAIHADIEDEGQTVNVLVPEIGTTAMVDGEKEVNATEIFTLEDTVSYENLIPGKEYTLSGVLMDKTTGEPLLIGGEEIRSEVTFVPEATNGSVVVTFTFDSKYIKADTDIVVFESLYKDGLELAVHADIEDDGQTVTVHVPKIGTQATAEGKKEVEAKGKITIEDTVSYKNLTSGKEYTVSGVLMNKATGEPFTVNGEEIRSEVTFTPETADGEVTVQFTFNADGITTETEVVVFESLYREGVEIVAHADIEDEDQTVTLLLPPPPDNPQTGDNSNLGFWIGLGAVALGGLVATIIIGIKRKKDDDDE